MNTSPTQKTKVKPSIHRSGMDFLEEVLAPETASTNKPTSQLIAEEERRRVLEIVRTRLTVLG